MPYVHISTTEKLCAERVKAIRALAGETIALIPEKSLAVTMIEITPEAILCKGDSNAPAIFIDVRLLGKSTLEGKTAFAEAIAKGLSEMLNTAPEMIYLNIAEQNAWGANGGWHEL